jgi:hypothetical protein
MRFRRFLERCVSSALLVLLASSGLEAQEIWPLLTERNYVRVEAMRSSWEDADIGFFNGVLDLSLARQMGERQRLVISFPISRFSPEESTLAGTKVGNPYLGIDLGGFVSGWYGQVGARLPIMSDSEASAAFIGTLTDFDRAEAFLVDVTSLIGTVGYRHRESSGLMVQGRLGGSLWLATGDAAGDSELLAHYGFRVGYDRERILLGLGLTGRLLVTEEDAEDRGTHQITLDLGYRLGRFIPSVGLRLPVEEELSNVLNSVVIVSLKLGL